MPSSNIQSLKNACVRPIDYFVDANVWIYALRGDDKLRGWQKEYVDYFYEIIESSLEPKILFPTMLFSEVLNTWLKKIAMEEYKALNGIPESGRFYFKRDYRPTAHYRENYERICEDVSSFKSSLLFIDDSCVVVGDPPIYIKPVFDFDFNDYFYYQICREFQKSNPVTILTNDGDFQISDIPIVTSNKTLLYRRLRS